MAKILDQFDVGVLRACIRRLPDQFHTRDVSEDQEVRDAHLDQVERRNYRADVGRVIKREATALGVREVVPRRRRGSLWARVGRPAF